MDLNKTILEYIHLPIASKIALISQLDEAFHEFESNDYNFLTKAYKKIIKPAVNFATKHQDIIGDTVKCASPVVQHAFNKFQAIVQNPGNICF